ncbi:MAG: hypothetical protein Q4B51_03275 [Coriobacteriaceae bacterium]|nr:hypothetical protein [Coriobacteriaceae bacterium]
MVQLQKDASAKSIEFSEFVQLVAPYLKGDMSQAEYTRTLLLGICSFEDLDNNPVSKTSDESMKRYYTGERGIGSLAAKIVPDLDSEQLEPMFERLSFEAEMGLYKSLSPYCPSMTDQNVAEEASRLLVCIVTDASSSKRGTKRPASSQPGQEDMLAFIQEADCHCALCGRMLIKRSSGKVSYACNVTRITPGSLNSAEINSYAREGIKFPEPGSSDDFIALCPNCSRDYQSNYDKGCVRRLLETKHSFLLRNAAAERLGKCDLEEEIEAVLDGLCSLSPEEVEVNLRLEALALKDKIEDSEPLLRDRIGTDVARYYRFVEDGLRRLSEERGFGFDRTIAAQVQIAYLAASSFNSNQSAVYEALVNWLIEKAPTCERVACEIVISFFVQNCEVFDEIAR